MHSAQNHCVVHILPNAMVVYPTNQLYLLLRKHKNQYFAAIDKNVSICTKMYETALFCNVQKYMKCTKMYENVQNVQKCTKQHYFAMCKNI